jgi:hypothetical protein
VRSVEGSIEQKFGAQRILFGAFRTRWENLVESRALTNAEVADLQRRGIVPFIAVNQSQYRNVASIENYGWNGALSGIVGDGHVRYGVNATAAYSRRAVSGATQRLDVAPQLFGNAHLAYSLGKNLPMPAIVMRYVGKRPVDRASQPDYDRLPDAPAYAEFRLTVSGPIADSGFGYRLSAAYATVDHGPYVAGPSLVGEHVYDYAPLDRFRVFVGLRYDFLTGANASTEGAP